MSFIVIAEGVELEKQRDFLIEEGCEQMQGFLYSKPVGSDELVTILQNQEEVD